MAKVILKKSSVPGKVPLVTDLDQGEVAVNTADLALFTKDASNNIKQLNAPQITVSTTAPSSPVLNQLWLDIS